MKHFTTIEKIDTGILYCLELASSLSVLLLAFGLIASMANGSVRTENKVGRHHACGTLMVTQNIVMRREP